MTTQPSFLSAVKWAYAANLGERAFSAAFTFVLAAMLGPRDFGIIAIAMVYISFLQMFLEQGLVAALIQKKGLQPKHLDSVFLTNMAVSLFLVGVSILLSRRWAAMNHAPDAALIISVLSLCIPIEGLAIVQKTLLTRALDFRSLSIRSNVSVVASGIVGIAMAFAGFRAWALVAQQIVRDVTALVLLWKLSTWRPRPEFSWKHLRDLMGFSSSNFLAQLGIFADMHAGSILLGMLFGPIAVGLYRLAERLMNTAVVTATGSIQAVSLPEFSRLQAEPDKLRKSVLTCIRLSSTVALPLLTGLAAVSRPLMAAIGLNWMPASNVLKVLCVLGMTITFAYFTGPLLQALARTRQIAILEWARTLIGILFLAVAGLIVRDSPVSRQIMGIALARFATGAFIVTPVFVYILLRHCRISLGDLIVSIVPSVGASLSIVAVAVLFWCSGWLTNSRPLILLVAEIVTGGIMGIVVLLYLDVQLRTAIAVLPRNIFPDLVITKRHTETLNE